MRKPVALVLMAVALAGAVGALALLSQSRDGARQEGAVPRILRVGVVALPPERGYPWNSTGVPTIYTYRAIFDGLTFVTEAGDVEPFLATSWEMLDPLTWRFRLRENVTFSNGAPFTADAVVFAIETIIGPQGAADALSRELRSLAGAEAENPLSVVIRTKEPQPLLPAALEMLLIAEPGQFARLGRQGFAGAPVGTGPFQVVAWDDAKATLTAFKQSWRAPKVDGLEFYALPDTAARIQALLGGRIDIAVALGREDVAQVEAGGGRGHVSHTTSTLGVTFILTKLPPDHPLQDVRVRQALNYAVNKEGYIKALFGDDTRPAGQPTTPSGFGYNPDVAPYPYDPAKARALLAEAGYPNGFSFTAEVTIGGGAALAETYQQAAADLAAVGVTMTLRLIPVQQLIRGVQGGEWQGAAFGMNYSAERTTDALRSLRMHSCLGNVPWYCDRAVTAKIERAYGLSDLAERRALTREIMADYHDQAPAIWLHEIAMFEGLSPRVRNYQVDHTVIGYHLIELAE